MFNRMPFNRMHTSSLRSAATASALALSLSACSGDDVELGEVSRDLESKPATCQAEELVQGSVVIDRQEQIDQLAGCTAIEGDLVVRPFEGADFRPLSALTRVGGLLGIGLRTLLDYGQATPEQEANLDTIVEAQRALIDAGWLTSLEGFENLTRAGRLSLSGVGASDLAPLSNLSVLTEGGVLQISTCTNLRDLTGLSSLTGVVELNLQCDSLESLAGPRFAASMNVINIAGPFLGNPPSKLVDLGQLAPERVNTLGISGTSIQNLDALAFLGFATSIDLSSNPELTNADGLSNLAQVGALRISDNDKLERLPELTMYQLDQLSIVGNATLQNVPSLPNLGLVSGFNEWGNLASEDAVRVRPDIVQINGNPSLESVVIPPGWLAASYIEIGSNDNLKSIDLSSLHAVDRLVINTHPLLESVSLGLLETVDDLRIIDNPLLPLEPFDAIQTFERLVQAGPLDL